MEEANGLSLTRSIDYFSDGEVDIYNPPVLDRHDDSGIDVTIPHDENAEFAKSIPKLDLIIEQPPSKQFNEPELHDTRDTVEADTGVQPPESRECMPEVCESNVTGPEVGNSSPEPKTDGIVNDQELSDNQSHTIKQSSSNATIVPYPTLEMVEVFDMPESEAKGPNYVDNVGTPREAEDITTNLSKNSLKKTKTKDSLGTPQPSVSFAEDIPQDGASLAKTASGLSKKSLYSRVSRISAKKSRSKDSVVSTKSAIEKKFESGDVSEAKIETKSTPNIDVQSEENVSLGTFDNPEKHDVATESSKSSIKTKASKDSTCSKISEKKVQDFVVKTSNSKDESSLVVISPVTSPKLYGPPRRLPRWGGIPKPEKSVGSSEKDSENPPSAVCSVPESNGILGENDNARDQLDEKVDDQFVSDNASVSPQAVPEDTHEHADEEPCIDATSTLTSSSGKRSSRSKKSDAKSSSTQVTSNAKGTNDDGKMLSKVADNEGTGHIDEYDFVDSKKNTDTGNGDEQMTIDVKSIENDPIQEVMKPFSPMSVPVCATEEDAIMKNLSQVCLSGDVVENENDNGIQQTEVHANADSLEENAKGLNSKKTLAVECESTSVSRKKLQLPFFGILGRSTRAKTVKSEKRNSISKLESLESDADVDVGKNATEQRKLSSLRKDAGRIMDSPTRDEVEVVKPVTPKATKTKSMGFFGNSMRKSQPKSSGLKESIETESKTTVPTSVKGPEHSNEQLPTISLEGADESQLPSESIANTIPVGVASETPTALEKTTPLEDGTNNFDVIVVDENESDLLQEMEAKEFVSNKAPILKAKNQAKSVIKNFLIGAGTFQKSRVSNEQKRRTAMKSLGKSRKMTPNRKERDVKVSALIDEQVVVENLHVAVSESPKEAISINQAEAPEAALPSTRNVNPIDENVDNFAPIILVDCRSSKGIETIGKVHTQTPKSTLKGKMSSLLSPFSRSAKIYEPKQVAAPAESNDVDRGYASGDTVTEAHDVELTKVAHLDVPFASNNADTIPSTVLVDEFTSENQTKSNSDSNPSADVKRSNSSSWMAPFVAFFSPKVSSSTHEKSNAEAAERKDSHFDEALAEFNECHNFYAQSCTELNDSILAEEVTKSAVVADDVAVDSKESESVKEKSWTDHILEWILPNSKQSVETTVELKEAASEDKQELIDNIVVVSEVCSEIPEYSAHEGTEIAIDCPEPPATTESELLPKKVPATKSRRFLSSFSFHGKSVKVTEKSSDALDAPANGQSSQSARTKRLSKFFTMKPKKEIEQVNNTRAAITEPPTQNSEKEIELAPTEEAAQAVNPQTPIELREAQEDFLPKAVEKMEASNALFTFTSDECPTDATNSGQKTSLAETKNTPQKGCCEDSNVMNGVGGFDDDTSRDKLHNFISKQPPVELDDDVESSVGYLTMVKNKRQARRNRSESCLVESSRNSVVNEKESSIREEFGQVTPSSDKNYGKVENPINSSEMDVHRRVSAVSDEVVDEMKTNLSSASSSLPVSLYESKDGPGKSSYLSSIEGKESKDISIREQPGSRPQPRSQVSAKPPRAKRGIPSTKANRRPIQHKEDDSIGVTVNSQVNTFDDDLSGVFAPVTKSGKWLW